MAVLIAAGIGAAASLAGGAMSADAAKSAAGQQSSALQAATGLQENMFRQINSNNAPFLNSGIAANNLLGTYLGIANNTPISTAQVYQPEFQALAAPIYAQYGVTGPGQSEAADAAADTAFQAQRTQQSQNNPNYGSLLHQFSAADLNTNLAPNYQFMLGQGQTATTNAANLAGGAISGNALKALNDYTQNYAQNAYQQAYENYNTNQTNIYNRLMGVSNQGQAAANQTANYGTQLAQGMAGTTAAAGAAQAGGTIGAANAFSGALNNAGSYYTLGTLLRNNNTASGSTINPAVTNINGSSIDWNLQ